MLLWQTDISKIFFVVYQAIPMTAAENPQVHTSEVQNPFTQDKLICIITVDLITCSYFGGNTSPQHQSHQKSSSDIWPASVCHDKRNLGNPPPRKKCGKVDMKTWWMGAWVWRISHCNYCVTLMHHMMHWPLPNWNFLVQEALIPPIGICQPREACFCVDLSTSTSSKAFFCCRWGYRLIVSRNSVCASSPPATSIFTGMYNIATDHNHHVISRLYLPCRQRPNVIHNIPFGFHSEKFAFRPRIRSLPLFFRR